MKQRTYLIIALILIELMISLPVAFSAQMNGLGFIGLQGPTQINATGPLVLDVELPSKVNDHRVDLNITATATAKLQLFVDGQLKRTVFSVPQTGTYLAKNIPLPRNSNNVTIRATFMNESKDVSGIITVDRVLPNVQLDIPTSAQVSPLVVNGSTNKNITLRYRITEGDPQPPEDVLGLSANTSASGVQLHWLPVKDLDLKGYVIYRDGALLSTMTRTANVSLEEFEDDTVGSGKSYVYQVEAIDKSCTLSGKKESVTIIAPSSAQERTPQRISLGALGCEYTEEMIKKGTFTVSLAVLTNTTNHIEIIATDEVGNTVRIQKDLLIDVEAPQFLDTNLETLSPTYDPFVTIRGNTNEPAAITVMINGKVEETENTDGQNHFSIDVTLRRDVNASINDNSFGFEAPSAWDNEIVLIATDAAGNSVQVGPEIVQYALCSSGLWYDIDVGDAIPDAMNPRLLLEGLQNLGFSFSGKYTGNYNVTFQSVEITAPKPSPHEADKLDNDYVTITAIPKVDDAGNFEGYAQVNLRIPDPEVNKTNATTFDKEQALSERHKGDCLIPELGCVRLRMIMETKFQEIVPAPPVYDPNTRTTFADAVPEPRTQKTCIDMEVAIDKRIPPDIIPSALLRFLSDALDRIMKIMDNLMKPLTTIGTYLVYACFASSAVLFLLIINEKWSCDFSSTASLVLGGAWNKEVAQIGMCETIYDGQDDASKEKRDACTSCQSALERSKDFEEEVLRTVCDRTACPSAPTWQTHIKNAGNSVEDITSKVQVKLNEPDLAKWKFNNKIWAGNDCATLIKDDAREYGLKGTDYQSLLQPYRFYQNKANVPSANIKPEDCEETLRPAHPYCCGEEYMEQWGTACGVTSGTLDTFDEIKESMCLAAQKKGKNSVDDDACSSLWNSAAGFCEPNSGAPLPELIRTGVNYKASQAGAKNNEEYLIVKPIIIADQEVESYEVFLGYVTERFQFTSLMQNGSITQDNTGGANTVLNNSYLTADLDVAYRVDITSVIFNPDKTTRTAEKGWKKLRDEICKESATGSTTLAVAVKECEGVLTKARSKALFTSILSKITEPDKEYIVIPDEGLLRSIQCVCIPALVSWLKRWKQILGMAKLCFDTIETTGDGSAGACQAFVSEYACDLIYDALVCFTRKFGQSGAGTSITGELPFGNVFGAISAAGTDMNRRVTGRYGETALFNTLFNDRKLVNEVCLFAFTGEWNLDVEALVTTAVEDTPIPSQGMLKPCRRRFNGYNIATNPPGLVNWVYEFSAVLLPGTDVRYSLELVCSEGFTCDPMDGFKNGECDCNTVGEKRVQIRPEGFGSGTLKTSDKPMNAQLFFPLNALRPEAPPNVRYDKAVLKWESTDPKLKIPSLRGGEVECVVDLEGSDAPVECSWDLFTQSFRCQFGFQTSKIALRDATPVYKNVKKGTATKVFNMNETVAFDIDIRQQFPTDLQEQLTGRKFIGHEIKNHHLVTVSTIPEANGRGFAPGDQLERDGDYTLNKRFPLLLSRQNFLRTKTLEAGQLLWLKGSGTLPGRTVASASDYILNPEGLGNISQLPAFFVVVFEGDSFKVFPSSGNRDNAADHFFDRGTGQLGGTTKIATSRKFTFEKKNGATAVYSIAFSLLEKPKELTPTGRVEILVPTGGTAGAKAPTCESGKVVQWTAAFTVYDADEYGQASNQLSTDASTGQTARIVVPFNVMCGGEVQDIASATVTPGAPTVPVQPVAPTTGTLSYNLMNSTQSVMPYSGASTNRTYSVKEGDYRLSGLFTTGFEVRLDYENDAKTYTNTTSFNYTFTVPQNITGPFDGALILRKNNSAVKGLWFRISKAP